MRCTEGIWMSIKLIIHSIKDGDNNNCNLHCSICGKNKCCLFNHEIGKKRLNCLCNNCKCEKECLLNGNVNHNKEIINCDLKCCFRKNHDNLIKCSIEGCECKCICECICDKNKSQHEHLCYECKNLKKNICECDCNCKHLCKIPILLHNFICVCLDFEGLGTFERTNDQDIQMALIGSAMGNSVIFRTGNSFDRFTENTLEKLALGSNKLKSINIEQFFGGSLFFSPKDVLPNDRNKLKIEFTQKIENSVKRWNYSKIQSNIEDKNNKNNYSIFGLFDDNVFAPTPFYLNLSFYKTLRDKLTPEIIENTLKLQRHPIYKTGKEFCSNLKLFLSAVYMNEYEFLSNYKEDMIKSYINENVEKAFEVSGIYKELDLFIEKKILIKEENKLKLYFNNNFLDNLEINFSYNTKFKNNNNLIVDDIVSLNDIQGSYNIENYVLKIDINKIKNNIFSMSIKNLNDFGLILMIPKEIKEIIDYNELSSDLFKIWDSISKKIGWNHKETIDNFKSFILSLIKRRNNNVSEWIKEITKDFNNLKDLQKHYSPLDSKWIICQQSCKDCFYKCYLLQGHEKEHKCPYDHKCEEKCSICLKCNCNDEKCKQICYNKSGHPDIHSCGHFHQCKEDCEKKKKSIDCKGICILEFEHKEKHNCGLKIHHCNDKCYLIEKTKNCGKKCSLEYPHDGEHLCGEKHFCKEKCDLKEKAIGCKGDCKLKYGHNESHNCGEKHFCKEKCDLKEKTIGCKGNCELKYGHYESHNCGEKHFCKEKCDLKEKTIGCKGNCELKYGHNESHNCGGKHICNKNCELKNISKNCGEKCNLEFPHEGKSHFCGKDHYCQGKCSLKDLSSNCENNCCLKYGHENEQKCICIIPKERHICNKKCNIVKKCNENCILISGHEGKCLCGKCNCPEFCKYKDCSRNCNEKCQYLAGHPGKDHICETSKHYCKFECSFKDISINCNQSCYLEVNHSEINHICNISQNKHICKGKCYLKEKSRNCDNTCSLVINHEGEHLCKIPSNNHLCNNNCDLYKKSLKCNQFCIKNTNHLDKHICSLNIDEHICKEKCSLFNNSREGCKEFCYLLAGHEGECFCGNSKEEHKCAEFCQFYDKAYGCEKYCNLPLGHIDEHICTIPQEKHICKGYCHLKGKTRGNCFNYSECCLPFGHDNKCICSRNHQHLCNEKCSLFKIAKNGCNQLCNLIYGHDGKNHSCGQIHLCPNNCYYYLKSKGKCNQFCNLPYNHKEDKCLCKDPHTHLCTKECSIYSKSGGCYKDCSLIYEHEGKCFCGLKKNFHTCIENCQLCNNVCGHAYNHQNDNNISCNKCNNNFCILSKKNHLCGAQHNCKEDCKKEGWCYIESIIKPNIEIYKSKSGEEIYYDAIKYQEIRRNKCTIEIEKNKFSHENVHNCGASFHKCGVKCPQCEYCCTEIFGHTGLHFCLHGNIKNSFFSVSNNYAMVRKDNKSYKFIEGETAKIFLCDSYCKNQGQGHTHLFEANSKITENNNVKFFKEENKKYIYECKCLYFWENILKFNPNFTKEENHKFALCNWRCKYSSHQLPEFCQLPLWHDKVDGIPKGIHGTWNYQGHVFKCIHPIGVYSIFLIDQSGSMESKSINPTNNKIKKKMDNMLGAAIQAIYNFCMIRASLSPRDMSSLIGFNENANTIFENIYVGNNIILNNCLTKLKPNGATFFIKAFEEAKKILEKIDRTQYFPIIILLTDGLDHKYEETLNFIEKEVNNFIFINIFIINIDNDK